MHELIHDIANNEREIFSFGIPNGWTFEDMTNALGSTVYEFDPSVNFPSKRGRNITFEKLGVAAKKNTANLLDTLGNILKKYQHEYRKKSYLKMNIEDSELDGLPTWLSEGALINIQQIAAEIHLKGKGQLLRFLRQCNAYILKGITD